MARTGGADSQDRESRAYELLRDKIVAGELEPAERLSQSRLAVELQMSRTPIRAAFQRLKADGLITMPTDQSKPVVAPVSAGELEVLYLTLGALEGLAARLAARRMSAFDAALLRSALEEERNVGEGRATSEEINRLSTIHGLLVAMVGSPVFTRSVEGVRLPLDRYRQLFLTRHGATQNSHAFHEKIVDAVIAGDGDRAERLMVDHLADSFAGAVEALRRGGQLGADGRLQQ